MCSDAYVYNPRNDARCVLAPAEENTINFSQSQAQLICGFEFYNNTGATIVVGTRNGFKYELRSMYNSTLPRTLVITKRVTYNRTLVNILPVEASDIISQHDYDAYINCVNGNTAAVMQNTGVISTVFFQYTVSLEQLREGGVCYIRNLDLVVSSRGHVGWVHPESEQGIIQRLQNDLNINDVRQFSFAAEIVTSTENAIREKFINLNGKVYRVPVLKTSTRKAGVYIHYNGACSITQYPSPPITDYYPLEELDKHQAYSPPPGNKKVELTTLPILFFNTIQDALANGDYDRHKNHELEMLRVKAKELETEAIMLKANNARLEEEEKRHRAIVEEILKEKESIRQHQQKMSEMDRKEASEFFKWLPTILGGFLALSSILVKASK